MPREAWRDAPQYLALWRSARASGDPAERFVLADWLEDNAQPIPAWRERLTGITLAPPAFDPESSVIRAGRVYLGAGDWARLLAAPPPDELLCVFDREVRAYQYLRRYRGRCGWDVGKSDWSSRTERAHVRAVPRLELLACSLMTPDDWAWVMGDLTGLTHFEADGPMVEGERLADLRRLTRLRGLVLKGTAATGLAPLGALPGLRHFHVGPCYFAARDVANVAPGLESLHADVNDLGDEVVWPELRSLRMARWSRCGPFLNANDVKTLARHPKLERLDVCCTALPDEVIGALAGVPRLRELALRFAWVEPPPLKALAKAPALESLTIEGAANEERLGEVAAMAGLRSLTLASVKADRQSLDGLAGLRRLEVLKLGGECEDARALTALARLPNLETLDLRGLKAGRRTLEAVKAACPDWVECGLPDEEE